MKFKAIWRKDLAPGQPAKFYAAEDDEELAHWQEHATMFTGRSERGEYIKWERPEDYPEAKGWNVAIVEDVPEPASTPLRDMKAALSSGVKPDVSHVRSTTMAYIARGCDWGNSPGKYRRANYLVRQPDLAADLRRYRAYLAANIRHATHALDLLEQLESQFPDFAGVKPEVAREAVYAADLESGLPSMTGVLASAQMAVQQAVDAGLLPADPGRPWEKK